MCTALYETHLVLCCHSLLVSFKKMHTFCDVTKCVVFNYVLDCQYSVPLFSVFHLFFYLIVVNAR